MTALRAHTHLRAESKLNVWALTAVRDSACSRRRSARARGSHSPPGERRRRLCEVCSECLWEYEGSARLTLADGSVVRSDRCDGLRLRGIVLERGRTEEHVDCGAAPLFRVPHRKGSECEHHACSFTKRVSRLWTFLCLAVTRMIW